MKYRDFISTKLGRRDLHGFDPVWMPDFLFDFQRELCDWSIRVGRDAVLADCGLGKTIMQLVWAQNVVEKTNRSGLVLTPLTVSKQTMREGEKFGIEVHDARDGKVRKGINVANYERLHYFDPRDFGWVVCDESSCLKNFDAKRRKAVTQFLSGIDYRLLCSATPAPNDFIELGSSSEALGVMGRNQMLGMFFSHRGDSTSSWELKGHSKRAFWRWVAGWARAIRKPSDFGFEDGDFQLPPIKTLTHTTPGTFRNGNGNGFFNYAVTLDEQRREKQRTVRERCEKVAEIIPLRRPVVVWCHYNAEGDLLERLIPDAVQVAGKDSDDIKEERLGAFIDGSIRVLVTKPKIAGFGMNWQHCADVSCFPSNSYEQYYQMVRRCWRFGQQKTVRVNIVATEAESPIVGNMIRKEQQAVEMFEGIIREMRPYQRSEETVTRGKKVRLPAWL